MGVSGKAVRISCASFIPNGLTPSVSKNSSKVFYLDNARRLGKHSRDTDTDDEERTTELQRRRFPLWLVVTAYVIVGLSVLHTAWGLLRSLSR